LHTHYALSNAYNRNVDNLPEFPKTSGSGPKSAQFVLLTSFRSSLLQVSQKRRQRHWAKRLCSIATGESGDLSH
jgi:hypothetical protein